MGGDNCHTHKGCWNSPTVIDTRRKRKRATRLFLVVVREHPHAMRRGQKKGQVRNLKHKQNSIIFSPPPQNKDLRVRTNSPITGLPTAADDEYSTAFWTFNRGRGFCNPVPGPCPAVVGVSNSNCCTLNISTYSSRAAAADDEVVEFRPGPTRAP